MKNKKRNIIIAIIIILLMIIALWLTGIIPTQIAKIAAIQYAEKNLPKMQLEYVSIEWNPVFEGYSVIFKDKNNKLRGLLMNDKYFPITPGQGIFALEEEYRQRYGQDSNKEALKAVVVKVEEQYILAMGIEETFGLYSIATKNTDPIELKKGQEILIHFNGEVMASYPAQLGYVGKIEVLKEESNIPIPDNIIRYSYNSRNNVTIRVDEITKSSITLTIKDTNDLPYQYSHNYKINQKVKNEDYTGVGQKIGENTNNSTAGFTRNRFRI